MNDTIARQLIALQSASSDELRKRWHDLNGSAPPPYNRKFLVSRLAYRLQELSVGGLSRETEKRLQSIGEQLDGGNVVVRRTRTDRKPIAGTRLVREFRGIEHSVLVTKEGYEYRGQPFKSLSAVARAITGTRWNGWIFFGLVRTGERT